jgi:hypothetical protein
LFSLAKDEIFGVDYGTIGIGVGVLGLLGAGWVFFNNMKEDERRKQEQYMQYQQQQQLLAQQQAEYQQTQADWYSNPQAYAGRPNGNGYYPNPAQPRQQQGAGPPLFHFPNIAGDRSSPGTTATGNPLQQHPKAPSSSRTTQRPRQMPATVQQQQPSADEEVGMYDSDLASDFSMGVDPQFLRKDSPLGSTVNMG